MRNDMQARVAAILNAYGLRNIRELQQKISDLKRLAGTERTIQLLELAVAAYQHDCDQQ